jgi:two-component system, chemotaxis family, chemotaxis protein CheY
MNVLIVDDSPIVRVILKRNLIAIGVRENEIYEAENGEKGLARFRVYGCGAIVTDLRMPVMDGVAFVKEIRKLAPDIPIAMVTAANEKDQVVEAIASGVNDYLVKPFAAADLRKKLTKLWLRAQQVAENKTANPCCV